MFAPRYFAVRYFAPRYWPPGADGIIEAVANIERRLFRLLGGMNQR